jgi:hypothetical protein
MKFEQLLRQQTGRLALAELLYAARHHSTLLAASGRARRITRPSSRHISRLAAHLQGTITLPAAPPACRSAGSRM